MKRKIFSILFALVLACSLGLVTVAPAAAATPELELGIKAPGATAEWSTAPVNVGTYSVHLKTGATQDGNEGRIVIDAASVGITTLSSITSIAWSVYTVAGYPPHVDIYLDCDGDGVVDAEDVLTAEMAYNNPFYAPEVGSGVGPALWFDGDHVNDSYGAWFQTFEATEGDGFGTVDDTTLLWLCKLGTGTGDAPSGTLAQWIAGEVGSDPGSEITPGVIDGTTPVVRLEIEVDSWVLYPSEAYIDDLTINEVTYDVEWTHVSPIQVDDDRVQYPDAPFQTIQGAIDCAIASDIIDVYPGTYTEDPVIDESLTLSGPNAAISPNTGTRVAEAIIDGTISVAASDITIKGFDFEVEATEDGIYYPQFTSTPITGLNILNNSFEEMSASRPASSADGAAIMFHIWAADAGVTTVIDDNLFTNIWAVYFEVLESAAVSTVTITDNVLIGATADAETPFAGISVKKVTGTISGNTITNTYDAGINVGDWCDDLTITDNTITNANTLNGVNAGAINLYSDCTDITITRNTLADSFDGITIKDVGALGSGIVINYNDITGNSNYGVLNSAASGTLDAQYNWWGGVAGPQHTNNPYSANATSQENDVVSDDVDYLPWMIHTELASGWNIYSTPIAAESDPLLPTKTDTIDKALDLWGSSSGDKLIAYYYDGENQYWDEPTSLTPLQAVYIKMAAAATIDVVVSSDATFPPSTVMYTGWNLVGPAELYNRLVDVSLSDALYGTGVATDLWGYSKAISPAVYQTYWTFLRGDADGLPPLIPTEGYWVLMVNQGILGGFTYTPIYYVVP